MTINLGEGLNALNIRLMEKPTTEYYLKLFSKQNIKIIEYFIVDLTPTSLNSTFVLTILSTDGLNIGEYIYNIEDSGGKICRQGLAYYGDYTSTNIKYNNDTKITKTYERS